jgi:hypothetical protein
MKFSWEKLRRWLTTGNTEEQVEYFGELIPKSEYYKRSIAYHQAIMCIFSMPSYRVDGGLHFEFNKEKLLQESKQVLQKLVVEYELYKLGNKNLK